MRFWQAFALVVALVGADQTTKAMVEAWLPLHQPVNVLPFLSWLRIYNEGISFSFLDFLDARLLAMVMGAVAIFVVWLWMKTPATRWLAHLGFAFIVSGAIGNIIDRVLLGHVIDFVQFHLGNWSFAIFNLADAFITIGAIAVILDELLALRTSKTEN